MSDATYMFEIDFLPVGTGEKSGDAIAVRYGYLDDFKVMVIDGGTKASGQLLVDHIKTYYGVEQVDYVVNTHPDGDHASGLSIVLEQLEVGELWMHRPWEHSSKIRDMFKDGRITDNSLSERLKDSLNAAYRLEELANEKGIKIREPFQGKEIGEFVVLSPSRDWYRQLVPQFSNTPEAKFILSEFAKSIYAKVVNFVEENWDVETLPERGENATSANNLSSVVLYGVLDGRGILFTGDAGIETLNHAADYAEEQGCDIQNAKFVQVPHHGSRHNVSPSVLDRILGGKVSQDAKKTRTAYVSSSEKSTSHPKRQVVNAFQRRGMNVVATKGRTKRYSHNAPDREGWVPVEPLPFYTEVEE